MEAAWVLETLLMFWRRENFLALLEIEPQISWVTA
jgi:hypothetical protein